MRPPSRRPAKADSIELDQIRAGYGRIEVLHGLSLKVRPATILALLGPNGAGKSTTIKVASRRLEPSSGQVRYGNLPDKRYRPDALARSGVCCVPEGRSVFPSLTVHENVRMWTRCGGLKRAEVEEETFSRFPVLSARRRQLAGTLSGGEQQMLAMSRALSTHPGVLLLDEVSMGLAPKLVAQLFELIAQIAAAGVAIIVVEQFVNAALSVATQAAIMSQGEVVFDGDPDDARAAAAEIYMRAPIEGEPRL